MTFSLSPFFPLQAQALKKSAVKESERIFFSEIIIMKKKSLIQV